MEILAPKGTKGTYLGRNAKEWLLSRNTTLKILSKPEVVNGKIVIKAEIYSQTPIEKIKMYLINLLDKVMLAGIWICLLIKI